jgi:hypothetical protein
VYPDVRVVQVCCRKVAVHEILDPQNIPKSSLRRWAQKKFHEGWTTLELLACSEEPGEKLAVVIVALLEVDPALRYVGMRADEEHYAKTCHGYLAMVCKDSELKA